MDLHNLNNLLAVRPIERLFGSSNETEEAVQLYAASVFLLIAVASFLAFHALDIWVLARILLTCSTLVGLYSLFFRISGQQGVTALVMIGALIALPFLPAFRYALYLAGLVGLLVLFHPGLKVGVSSLAVLPITLVAIFGSGLHLNFTYQNSITAGLISVDTFFHAAIAAMYGSYGVPSLGLDGLIPVQYHTLSHKIMSGIAILGGFEVLAAYAYIYFAMGPLLLVFSLAGFARQLDGKLRLSQAMLGTSLLFLAFISIPAFAHAAFWDSFFVSESYLIALVIFVASLSTLVRWIEGGATNVGQLVIALALLLAAGLSKGSVGLLGLCVFGLLGITRFRVLKYWLLLSLAVFLMYLGVIGAVGAVDKGSLIAPFDFIRSFVQPPFKMISGWSKLFFFLSIHFLPVWLCWAMGFKKYGRGYTETLEFEVVFALLVPALTFSMLIGLAGGAAYYFSGLPVVIALCFLVPFVSRRYGEVRFVEIVLLAIFCSFTVETRILNAISMKAAQDLPPHVEGLSAIVTQLQKVRDNLPVDSLVKVENPEVLVGMIGCTTYWFLPAVIQRPMIDGLPVDRDKCKTDGIPDGHYGLSDYASGRRASASDNFKIWSVTLESPRLAEK